MRRFGQSTPETIRDSHRVMGEVMAGRVTPHCQRAQRAYRVASRYPLEALPERLAVPVRGPVEPPARPLADARDKEFLLRFVFGSAAPQAERAFEFLGTPPGKRILAVSGLALGAILVTQVIP